jgi:hypothetical protein
MNVVTLESGTRGCDTVLKITKPEAHTLKAAGYDFVVRYLVSVTVPELADILSEGLAVSLVTYANSFDPSDEIAALQRLGIPHGVVVWLDVEDVHDDPITLQHRINTWAKALVAAGYIPGLYVGANTLLSSIELYKLAVTRYWHSTSRVLDRSSNEAAPLCGWAMHQIHPPNLTRAGIVVDVDFVQEDYKGRGVTMVAE